MDKVEPLSLTTRDHGRPIKKAMMATMVLGLFEAWLVGQYDSQLLLAYGAVIPLLLMADAVGYALGAAAASVFSRGVCTKAQRQYVFWSGGVAVLAGVVVTLLVVAGYRFIPQIAGIYGSAQFAMWYAPILTLIFVNHTGLALLRAIGKSALCAKILFASAAVHASALILFLADFFMPHQGIEAVAWAYIISSCTVLLLLFLSRQTLLAGHQFTMRLADFREYWHKVRAIVLMSTCSNLMTPLAAAIVIHLLMRQGDEYVAAFSIALKIEMFALVGFYAWSSVVGPLAGKRLISASSFAFSDVTEMARLCWLRGAIVAAMLALGQMFIGPGLLSGCITSIEMLRDYLLIVPVSYGAYGTIMLLNAICNGLGYPVIGLITSVLRAVALLVPFTWLFSQYSVGVFYAIALSNLVSFVVALLLIRYVLNRHNARKRQPPHAMAFARQSDGWL